MCHAVAETGRSTRSADQDFEGTWLAPRHTYQILNKRPDRMNWAHQEPSPSRSLREPARRIGRRDIRPMLRDGERSKRDRLLPLLRHQSPARAQEDEGGDVEGGRAQFTFPDATDPSQIVLFNTPQFDVLRRQIVAEFAGREVLVESVEEFVLAHTAFRETHYQTQVLKPLEAQNPPGLVVTGSTGQRRRGTFPSWHDDPLRILEVSRSGRS
jgi:hypothetical protein